MTMRPLMTETYASEPFAKPKPRESEHWFVDMRGATETGTSPQEPVQEPTEARPTTTATSVEETITRLPTKKLEAALGAARAGRELARRISQAERESLEAEHRGLTQRMIREGELAPQEARRLQYVRWTLDRVEDADAGEHLDRLRTLASIQERLSARIDDFAEHVRDVLTTKSRRW